MVGTSAFSQSPAAAGGLSILEVRYEIICGDSHYGECVETVYDGAGQSISGGTV